VFKKEFTPAHMDSLAINRLESTAYYQKSHSLDDYLDEFQDLVTDSGYTDPKTIVVKFRQGLNPPNSKRRSNNGLQQTC
jgi:Retrotransposon gag protein